MAQFIFLSVQTRLFRRLCRTDRVRLKYMRYFYEMYPDAVICPQVEDELITDANRPQVGDDLQIIFRIPWGHNKIILDKCKGNSAKALFYIRKTIENNWSRDVLLNFLGTDLYERQGYRNRNFCRKEDTFQKCGFWHF